MKTALLTALLAVSAFISRGQTGSWQPLPNNGLVAPYYSRMDDLFFWTREKGVAVNGLGAIFKTYDGGDTWQIKMQDVSSSYFRSIECLDDGRHLVAATLNNFVVRSDDSGETWQYINPAIPDTGIYTRRMCGLAHEGSSFFGVGWYGSTTARFFKSTDKGVSWQVSYLDSTLASGLVDIIALGNGKLLASGRRRYGAAKEESVVLYSANAGQSWSKVFSDTAIGGTVWKLQAVTPSIIYGSIQPLYDPDTVALIRSTDGGQSWSIVPVGRRATTSWGTQGVGFLNARRGWVGGYYTGMFETTDSGASWHFIPEGEKMNRFFRVDAGTMYASGIVPIKFYDSAAAASIPATATPGSREPHVLHPPSPNPAAGRMVFRVTLGVKTNLVLDVVDAAGRRVFPVAHGFYTKGDYSFAWDASGLPRGTYAVRLETDYGPVGKSFVISR